MESQSIFLLYSKKVFVKVHSKFGSTVLEDKYYGEHNLNSLLDELALAHLMLYELQSGGLTQLRVYFKLMEGSTGRLSY
ncbi:hypothetical protein PV328_003991, partial [Microctonus aethiopoides]